MACGAGYRDAGRPMSPGAYRKDVQRYQSDADYRNGWDQGYMACYEDERRTPKMMGLGGR
jgi:hypothetical protein